MSKPDLKELLERGAAQVLPSKQGLADLMARRKIRVYLGIDPTGTRLHLGHAFLLRKLEQFADLGHQAILVIGTGTVLAGDPSQREHARAIISEKEIRANIRTWKKQASKVIDFQKVKIKYNGAWLKKLTLKEILTIASYLSAAQLFKRDMFQARLTRGETVWLHEMLYPMLQGYDSVVLETDLEIGGTDQTFNMLVGRELLQKMLGREKFVLTTKMLNGLDGKPMSKTSGNCVWLQDPANEMFGKIMSLRDQEILPYFELAANIPVKEIALIKRDLASKKVSPRDVKARLAFEITKLYHGPGLAQKAAQEFAKVFKAKDLPTKIKTVRLKPGGMVLADLLVAAGLVESKSQAKRVIIQGGVKINRQLRADWKEVAKVKPGMTVQVGKLRFVKIA